MIFRTGSPRRLSFAGFAVLAALGGLLLSWTPAPANAQDDRPRKKKDANPPPGGDEKPNRDRGGDDDPVRQLEELERLRDKLKARIAAQVEKGGNKGNEDKKRGDEDRSVEELEQLRAKLKARLAELEKAVGGDPEKMREKIRERFQEKKKDAGQNPGGPDLQGLKQEMETRRAELEKMQRELQRKAEELRALGEKLGEEGKKFRFEFKFRPDAGDGPRKPDAPKPDQRGNDPRPNPGQRPAGGGDVERRLDEMERKLDMLLQEMRKGGQGGQGGPFGPGGFGPGGPRRGPGGPGGPGGNEGPNRKEGKEKASFEIELNLPFFGQARGPGKNLNSRPDRNVPEVAPLPSIIRKDEPNSTPRP